MGSAWCSPSRFLAWTISPCCQGREQNSLYQSFKDELAQDDAETFAMPGWMGEAMARWPCEESIKYQSNPVWGPFGRSSEIPFQGLSSSMFHHKVSECKNHKTTRALSYQSLSSSRTNRPEDSGFLPKIAIRCVGSAQFICNEGAVPIVADSHQRHNPFGFVCGRLVLG